MSFDFQLGDVRCEASHIEAERVFGAQALLFAGHFPNNKILPGVVLMEYALYLGDCYLREQRANKRVAEIQNVTFLAPVTPGMSVHCRCDFVDNADGTFTMKSVLRRDGTVCAKVKVLYAEG